MSIITKKLEQHSANPVVRYLKTNIGILTAFLIMFIFLGIASDRFLTVGNWINVARQISTNTMISIGVMMAILISGIDLTVGSVIALAGCIAVKAVEAKVPIPLAVILACGVGCLSGLVTGIIIAYTGMPPFVVTLAMQNVCRGASYLTANGTPIRSTSNVFESIGTGYLGPIPYPVIYTAVFLALTWFILNQTRLGRRIYAVGGNREAAVFSGINIRWVEIFVYTYSGMLAAFAGVVLAARMASGQPAVGIGYETDAVAASVLGGASMIGGEGTVGGLLIGALVIGILSNGLNLLGVNSFWQYIAKGVVIIIAVNIDMIRKKKIN